MQLRDQIRTGEGGLERAVWRNNLRLVKKLRDTRPHKVCLVFVVSLCLASQRSF